MSRTEELRQKFWGEKPEPVYFDETGKCLSCRGTGRNPLSDIVDWLPCTTCHGHGRRYEG